MTLGRGRVGSLLPGVEGRTHLPQGVAASRPRRGPRPHSAPRPAGDGLCRTGRPAGRHGALRDCRSARRLRALRAVANPRSRPGLGSRAPRRRCRDSGRGRRRIRAGRSWRGSSLSSSAGSCWSGRLPGSAFSPISSRSPCGSDISRGIALIVIAYSGAAPPRCPGRRAGGSSTTSGISSARLDEDRPAHRSARDWLSRSRPRPLAGCAACAGHPVRRRGCSDPGVRLRSRRRGRRICSSGPSLADDPVPAIDDLGRLALSAVAIALLAFADTSVLSRSYASRLGDRVDQSRELGGLAMANLATGLFQGFPDLEQFFADARRRGGRESHPVDGRRRGRRDRDRPRPRHGAAREHSDRGAGCRRDRCRPPAHRRTGLPVALSGQPR